MASWITEGTAHRTGVRRAPVMHLLVADPEVTWRMWCSAGRGREDSGYPQVRRCTECRKLAQAAVDEGDLSVTDPAVLGWDLKPGKAA